MVHLGIGLGQSEYHRRMVYNDGGFESGDFTGWTVWGTPSIRVVQTSETKRGAYAVHHSATGINDGSSRSIIGRVSLGEVYTFVADIKTVSSTTVRIQLSYQVDGGGWSYPQMGVRTVGSWERVVRRERLKTGTAITNGVLCVGGAGEAYIDNVNIYRG